MVRRSVFAHITENYQELGIITKLCFLQKSSCKELRNVERTKLLKQLHCLLLYHIITALVVKTSKYKTIVVILICLDPHSYRQDNTSYNNLQKAHNSNRLFLPALNYFKFAYKNTKCVHKKIKNNLSITE